MSSQPGHWLEFPWLWTITSSTSPNILEGKLILLHIKKDTLSQCCVQSISASANYQSQPDASVSSKMQSGWGMDSLSLAAYRKEKNPDVDEEGKTWLSHYVLSQAYSVFQNGLKSKQLLILHEWEWEETYWIIASYPGQIKSQSLRRIDIYTVFQSWCTESHLWRGCKFQQPSGVLGQVVILAF